MWMFTFIHSVPVHHFGPILQGPSRTWQNTVSTACVCSIHVGVVILEEALCYSPFIFCSRVHSRLFKLSFQIHFAMTTMGDIWYLWICQLILAFATFHCRWVVDVSTLMLLRFRQECQGSQWGSDTLTHWWYGLWWLQLNTVICKRHVARKRKERRLTRDILQTFHYLLVTL